MRDAQSCAVRSGLCDGHRSRESKRAQPSVLCAVAARLQSTLHSNLETKPAETLTARTNVTLQGHFCAPHCALESVDPRLPDPTIPGRVVVGERSGTRHFDHRSAGGQFAVEAGQVAACPIERTSRQFGFLYAQRACAREAAMRRHHVLLKRAQAKPRGSQAGVLGRARGMPGPP